MNTNTILQDGNVVVTLVRPRTGGAPVPKYLCVLKKVAEREWDSRILAELQPAA